MNRQTYKEMTHDFRADTRNVASANPTLGAVGRTWLHKQLGLDKTLMPLVPPSYMWSFWMDRAATERQRLQEVVSTAKKEGKLPDGVPPQHPRSDPLRRPNPQRSAKRTRQLDPATAMNPYRHTTRLAIGRNSSKSDPFYTFQPLRRRTTGQITPKVVQFDPSGKEP